MGFLIGKGKVQSEFMEHYKEGLSTVFWGLILVFLDFNINQVSIIPDFVGYLLVLSGIKQLSEIDTNLDRLKKWTYMMILMTIISWLYSFKQTANLVPGYPFINVQLVLLSIEILVSICFFTVLMDYYRMLSEKSEEKQWSRIFQNRKWFYVITYALGLLIIPMTFIFTNFQVLLNLVLLLMFVALLRIIMTAYRMKKMAEQMKLSDERDRKLERPFFLKKVGYLVMYSILLMISWGAGITHSESYRLSDEVVLPAFLADVAEERWEHFFLVVRNRQMPNEQSHFGWENQTIYSDYFFEVERVRFYPKEANETDVFIGNRSIRTDDIHYSLLPEVIDGVSYLEKGNEQSTEEGYHSSWKVKKSFKVKELLYLPFSEELNEYFNIIWTDENSKPVQDGRWFQEGDTLMLLVTAKKGKGELVSVNVPLRIKIEDTSNMEEKLIGLSWLNIYPNFDEELLKTLVD
jgi:hypothetical protein